MKKFLSIALALAMTLSLAVVGASAKSFTDSTKINYKEAVDVVSACKIIDGYTDGSFNPANTLTRGAAAKIICNMVLGPTTAAALGVSTAPFKDVSTSNVFAGYIAYCAQQGIINGYADKTFRPAGTVTGYQFLKMLLGALGYDGKIEGFSGANWEVNVAKLATNLGLYSGNDKFAGTAAMTREEACLYAYNTLNATMVEYANKGSEITINGVTISQGASKATAVTSAKDSNTIADETSGAATAAAPDTVQFAEQYFSKLVKTSDDSDAFMRPATTWKYNNTAVGTYAITADKTYTTATYAGTVYSDLGLSATVAASKLHVYVDGVADATQQAYTISKGDTTNAFGGRGVLTEVYNNYPTTGEVTIIEVNTYVGDVAAVSAKTASKDRAITVATRKGTSGTFTTDDFAVDDVVLYTYSNKTGDAGIQSVEKAKTVSGTLTAYTTNSNATVDGTVYKYAKQCANKADGATLNSKVDVVLDQYGNAIDVAASSTTTNYAVVLKYSDSDTWNNAKARLLFTDGSTKDVSLTANVDNIAANADVASGSIVTYTVNTKGLYTLTVKTEAVAKVSTAVTTNNSSSLTNIAASLVGNGSTIFLVKTVSNGDDVYTAYTGIKNVPTITTSTSGKVTYFAKTTNLATVVYIDATGATLTNSASDTNAVFVYADSVSNKIVDATKGTYYTYDAIVNGEITTLNIAAKANGDAPVATSALYTTVSYDTNKIASVSGASNVTSGTATVKAANEVVGLNGSYYSYSKDCKVFFIDTEGNITASSVASIVTDATDKVYFKTTDGVVTTIVIEKVSSTNNGFNVAAITGGAGASAVGDVAVATATGATTKAVTGGTTVSVGTDKTVNLVISNVAAGATVSVTPTSAQTLVSGTTAYTFTVIATAESGAVQTCTVTVNFTTVNA